MKKVLVVLLACFALVGAACGGSDDGDSASSSDAKSGSSSSDDTVAKGDPDSDFCDSARKFSKDFNDSSNADEEDQAKVFKDLRAAIEKLEDQAPDEIEDDVKVVADAFKESDDLLKKYDYDFTKVPEEEASKLSINDPKVTASSDRVESYFEKTCGIDSDGDGDTDGVMESSTTVPDDSSGTDDGSDGTDDTTETTAEGE
jgi:hypothetical protein